MNTLGVWNKARINDLTTLFHQGLSFSLIAVELGVSKNAACGKAHRMGLQPRFELTACKPREIRSPPFRHAMKPTAPVAPIVMETAPESVDYRCTILGLNDCTCRWPLWSMEAGEGDRWYCGHPTARLSEGRPYCQRHARLSYTSR